MNAGLTAYEIVTVISLSNQYPKHQSPYHYHHNQWNRKTKPFSLIR